MPPVKESRWGTPAPDHYGYGSEKERRARRGLEEWEMVGDHLPFESGRGLKSWICATLCFATVATLLLYFFGMESKPPGDDGWLMGTYWREILATIVYFLCLYTSLTIRLVVDSRNRGGKAGERRIITVVLVGVLAAVILGVVQIFFGYLL